MTCEIEHYSDNISVILSERCEVAQIESAHAELNSIIDLASSITVDALCCEYADMATLQWLIALKKHCTANEIDFELVGMSDEFADILGLLSLFDRLAHYRAAKAMNNQAAVA